MTHVIGFWAPSAIKKEWDRTVYNCTDYNFYEDSKYILDRSVKDLEEGEYIFDISNTIKNKKGDTVHFLVPHTAIVKGPRESLFGYLYSEYHFSIMRTFFITEESDKINSYDGYKTNFIMRVMRDELKYDWVPKEHTDESRKNFTTMLHDKMLNGEWNMYQTYLDTAEVVEDSSQNKVITPFDKDLPFNPEYDMLTPDFIPMHSSYSIHLSSTDIICHMKPVVISNPDDFEKYKPNIHPDVEIHMKPMMDEGIQRYLITMGYKIPDKNSDAYQNMIQHADISTVFLGAKWARPNVQISVPSTVNPNVFNEMEVTPEYYTDVLNDILQNHHIYYRKVGDYYVLYSDEDYKIMDFGRDKHFTVQPKNLISVRFKNGVKGTFSASEIATKKLKGRCLNATFTKSGDTLNSLTITFHKK